MLPLDGSGFLRFNLTRTVRAGGNAYLSLVPMSGDGWHQPERFAKLILPSIAGYSEITAIPQERAPVLMGNNNFTVVLTNHTGREQTAELRLKTSDGETTQEWRLPPHAKQQVVLPWKCGNAAGTFSWSLRRNGKEIHVSAPESYVIDNGNWSIPAVSYAGRKIVCRLKVNYGNDELKKARIRLHLRKDGIDFTAPQLQPFTEKLPLAGLPPGGYEAEILVISEDGKTLFQGKSDFSRRQSFSASRHHRMKHSIKMKFGQYDYAAFSGYAAYACCAMVLSIVLAPLAESLGFPLDRGNQGAGGALPFLAEHLHVLHNGMLYIHCWKIRQTPLNRNCAACNRAGNLLRRICRELYVADGSGHSLRTRTRGFRSACYTDGSDTS